MKKLTQCLLILSVILLSVETLQAQKIIYDTFNKSNWNPGRKYYVQQGRGVSWGKNYGYQGRSGGLRVKIGRGQHYGASIKYRFQDHNKSEPTALYAQYRVKYTNSFDRYFGKSPGFDGTYERAKKRPTSSSPGGWGNKRATGWNGWSARGSLHPKNVNGYVPNAFYCYHVNQKNSFGDNLKWRGRANMKFNQWYTVRQYVKLNDPNRKNGVLKAWVNGTEVYSRSDLQFRKTPKLKIFGYWINYYHGGSETSPKDAYAFIDDFSLSTRPFKDNELLENTTASTAVYPNPFTDGFKVDLGLHHKIKTISLYDTSGREILKRDVIFSDKEISIDLKDKSISKGIYILKTIGEESSNTYKIIKD